MPPCSYRNCQNSSKKKLKMNSFPRHNPILMAKWIKNMDMKDWKYHQSAVLCEAHFEPHMWEKVRVDGTKKLKCDAVPTIFGDRIVKETKVLGIPHTNLTNDVSQPAVINVASTTGSTDSLSTLKLLSSDDTKETNSANSVQVEVYNLNSQGKVVQSTLTSILKPQDILNQLRMANSKTPIIIPGPSSIHKAKVQITDSESVNDTTETKESESDSDTSTAQTTGIILNKAEAKKIADERFEKMDKLLLKQLKLNDTLRKKLVSVNHKLQQLAKEEKIDHKTYLTDVFTDDQIRALELRHNNPKSVTSWSHKTMMKAIKLKQECGTRGYEELLRQKMPLPSIRTISRWCTARNIPIP
ncbi:uncharacterized protein LOC100678688 [Nasonia vitripennis]|uniref:THAP-type domain-containing protein n=1 Tax=Nasonia vitripennis TaxID=7425 RepID=A0A7M7ITH8_NASVI|nr:uncharacterized protein LOC100678688 [Nasonia vitripennis]XP_016844355.1 uncharacterized protein LOC100678688 [Nasonia vitripennis]